jgi:hypothetical protein
MGFPERADIRALPGPAVGAAAKGFMELRREPGEHPGWPEPVWLERRSASDD